MLSNRASFTRSSLDAELFLKEVLEKTCTNRPKVLVDHGPWYPEALRSLGLPYEQMSRGRRNSIESWFRQAQGQGDSIRVLPAQ